MIGHLEDIKTKLAEQPLLSLSEVKARLMPSAAGFYWIYSSLSLEDFRNAVQPTNPVHVNFSALAKIHTGLQYVITQTEKDYWCIYNGKGKQLKNRIVAEFTNTEGKTGKLALLRCFKEEDFRIMYIECGNDNCACSVACSYEDLEQHLERVWRLHFGWPLLCRA